jgi:1-acyl-sn-glycerol-3-phosphate acyltransferase
MMMQSTRSAFQAARNILILWFGLTLLASFLVAGSILLVLRSAFLSTERRKQIARGAITSLFACYFDILGFFGVLHIDLSEIDTLVFERGLILAANHPSLLDALLITSRLPNVVCIMKEQVLKNILFGRGAKMAGYISNASARDIVSGAVAELQGGSHILLFPEGSRTKKDEMSALQGTVAVIAKRANAEVQTILIESDSGFLGKGWPVYRVPEFPVRFRVRLGQRFAPQQDIKYLMSELQIYFRQELSGIPKQPPDRLAA